jgi:hypothetical protein
MVELSVTQLESLESVVDFMKIDKMYNLIFDAEPQEPIAEESVQQQ